MFFINKSKATNNVLTFWNVMLPFLYVFIVYGESNYFDIFHYFRIIFSSCLYRFSNFISFPTHVMQISTHNENQIFLHEYSKWGTSSLVSKYVYSKVKGQSNILFLLKTKSFQLRTLSSKLTSIIEHFSFPLQLFFLTNLFA